MALRILESRPLTDIELHYFRKQNQHKSSQHLGPSRRSFIKGSLLLPTISVIPSIGSTTAQGQTPSELAKALVEQLRQINPDLSLGDILKVFVQLINPNEEETEAPIISSLEEEGRGVVKDNVQSVIITPKSRLIMIDESFRIEARGFFHYLLQTALDQDSFQVSVSES